MAKPTIRFKGYTDDWEQRKLLEFVSFFNGLTYTPDDVEETGTLVLRSSNVKNGEIVDADNVYVNDKAVTSENVHEGDIIVVVRNGSRALIGKHAQIKASMPNTVIGAFMSGMRSEHSSFVNALLDTSAFENEIAKNMGATINQITGYMFSKMEFMIPSGDEQQKIGEHFQSLDNLITLHQRKCEETKILKKYMLQKMFPQNGQKVPEIRFKGFTEDWEQRKLGELVIDHNAGIYISKEDYGEGTNVIGVGNIYDRDIFDGEIYRLGPVNDDKFILEENDILYGESSLVPEGIARTVCVGKNGAGSAFAWHTRRVKLDKNIVNSHVATLELNYLHDIRKYLVSVSTQTALTGMTTEGYFGATLTLPSVEEQQKISDYFKNLDNLITLHQRISLYFLKINTFVWEQRKLSELATMHARIGWQNLRTSEFLDAGDYMLITGTDFEDGKVNYSTCHYVEKERYDQDKNIQIKNGNILITKDGTLGKVAYVEGLSMPATLNAGVFNVEVKDENEIDSKYLFQFLKAPFLMDYVSKKATGGTIKHLNQSILVDFPIATPSKAEQVRIGEYFSNLDELITLHQRKYEELKNIKKFMLQNMFV